MVNGDGISPQASATIGRSAFRAAKVAGDPEDLGGNIEADPLLATDQFHQQEGSPTADRGAAVVNGPATDIDGEPHTQGPAPDIGADERPHVPPPPPPDPTPTPEPTPTPGPQTVPPDPTLPRVLSARSAGTPVAGRPSDLVTPPTCSPAASTTTSARAARRSRRAPAARSTAATAARTSVWAAASSPGPRRCCACG